MKDIITALSSLSWLTIWKYAIQIFIIVYVCLWVWRRIVGSQAERLIKGILVLSLIYLLFHWLGFSLITSILRHLLPVAIIVTAVVFQPEIRRGLGYLGRMKTFQPDFSLNAGANKDLGRDISEIVIAIRELSRNKIGALIVIEPANVNRSYVSPGTPVNADISSNLILNIFFPKSPLHDGALVIRQGKIIAAGVILPVTSNQQLSYKYGTRHRAALGLSEVYDGLCIVVSEETGTISAANRGTLMKYSKAEELTGPISQLYNPNDGDNAPPLVSALVNWIPSARKSGNAKQNQEA